MKKFKVTILLSILTIAACVFLCSCEKNSNNKNEEIIDETEKISDYSTLSYDDLQLRAMDGDEKAQYQLAINFDYGLNDYDQNFEDAKKWYEMASDAGNLNAMEALGYLYLNGCGVDIDLEKSYEYFKAMAVEPKDIGGAVGIAEVLSKEDCPKSVVKDLGIGYEDKDAYALFTVNELANNTDDIRVAYLCGKFFEKGIGCNPSYETAVNYFKKVTKTDKPELEKFFAYDGAITEYSVCLINGTGIEKNVEEAITWLEVAAEDEYPQACYYRGLLAEMQDEPDYKEAMEWYLKAEEEKYAPALNRIGYLYYKGYGVDVDLSSAVYYQKLAAMQGYAPAQINLGYFYEHGYGVTQDYGMAYSYYKYAADQNYTGATEAMNRVLSKAKNEN